jgi:hypothetical protein
MRVAISLFCHFRSWNGCIKLTAWKICEPAAEPEQYATKTTDSTTVFLVLPATLVAMNCKFD